MYPPVWNSPVSYCNDAQGSPLSEDLPESTWSHWARDSSFSCSHPAPADLLSAWLLADPQLEVGRVCGLLILNLWPSAQSLAQDGCSAKVCAEKWIPSLSHSAKPCSLFSISDLKSQRGGQTLAQPTWFCMSDLSFSPISCLLITPLPIPWFILHPVTLIRNLGHLWPASLPQLLTFPPLLMLTLCTSLSPSPTASLIFRHPSQHKFRTYTHQHSMLSDLHTFNPHSHYYAQVAMTLFSQMRELVQGHTALKSSAMSWTWIRLTPNPRMLTIVLWNFFRPLTGLLNHTPCHVHQPGLLNDPRVSCCITLASAPVQTLIEASEILHGLPLSSFFISCSPAPSLVPSPRHPGAWQDFLCLSAFAHCISNTQKVSLLAKSYSCLTIQLKSPVWSSLWHT